MIFFPHQNVDVETNVDINIFFFFQIRVDKLGKNLEF